MTPRPQTAPACAARTAGLLLSAGTERVLVVSAGAAARVNLFGDAAGALFATRPFQRPARDWVCGVPLTPGW